ncbi:TIP-1 family-domain-containing protein [Mortierella sp. GBAus27b]|nr:TIP-1 family-domain-containing protein [Mortierella sp. GBAus27b]
MASPSLAPETTLRGESGLRPALHGHDSNIGDSSGIEFENSPSNSHENNFGSNKGSNVVVFEQIIDVDEDVTDFFNSHFSTREDLAKVRTILQQRTEIQHNLSRKASLDALGWPKPILDPFEISDNKKDDFERSFKDTLLLQRPMYGELGRSGEGPLPPLLATELMVAPLTLRFRFHFDGKRPTNRLDKPEWYLTHILELVKDHTPFIQDYVQSIVEETEFKDYDCKNDFVRVLLQAVEDKIRQSVPDMLPSPEILSHAIDETLRFDRVLRDTEFYMPPGQTEWKGTVNVYLGNRGWLKTWLGVEKEFALARYAQIMEDTDAWQPAYEDMGEKTYIVPTKSAEKLSDLLEIITDRYRPLPVLEHRSFMLDIQLDLLIAYHRHIRGLVDQYESMTYSFVRVMPGTASADERNTTGVDGLHNLCQWLSSVEYFCSTLKDWSEDVFFLELYKEISERTRKISNPLHSDNEESEDEDARKKRLDKSGAIFDDAVRGFDTLSKRIQELIVRNITKDVFASMKPYASLRSWPQIEFSASDSNGLVPQSSSSQLTSSQYESDDVSPELYQPLTILSHSIEFLATTLPTRHFTTLYRQTSLEIQDFFWQKIIMKNTFSELGGMQFARDFRIGLLGTARKWVKKPENYHRKLRDAAVLLSLHSAKAGSNPPPHRSIGQERGGQGNHGPSHAKKTLAQVLAFLFDDDLDAEAVQSKLEEIGVMGLGVSGAKDVIRRRVECWR